ncbi:MAG: alpha/beta hydrolase [Patescibacteria group bacterium]|nr:alpha/beta hydrolase [Patescibacteria group bacterium]
MKTIVILHGWNSNLKYWLPVKKLLVDKGFKVYLPKLPSDRIRNTTAYSVWVSNYTKKLKPFYLVGHSFGGQIAINFTARYPDRIKRLILVNSAGVRRPSWKRKIIAPLAKLLRGYVHEKAKYFLYHLLLATDYYRANPKMRQTMARILTDDQQKNMTKINIPTLIIWGKDDHYTPLKDGRLTHRLIKNSLLEIFEARHNLPFTHSEALISLVNKFINA